MGEVEREKEKERERVKERERHRERRIWWDLVVDKAELTLILTITIRSSGEEETRCDGCHKPSSAY